ncbi:MAG: hypothetical protein U1F50_13800 [Rubrivivax sp.]
MRRSTSSPPTAGVPPLADAPTLALLHAAQREPARHLWVFSSSEAVRNLQALAPGADWSPALAVASHPRIAEAARAAGFGRVDEVRPSPADLAARVRAFQGARGRADTIPPPVSDPS